MMQMSFDYIERWLKRFEEAPLLVFWESTKACPLACRHCRAEAIKKPYRVRSLQRRASSLYGR